MSISRREVCLTAASAVLVGAPAVGAVPGRFSKGGGDLATLRRWVKGRLIVPDDADYAVATRGRGPTGVDTKHPSAIVLPAGPEDVAAALLYAQSRGLEVAVRSGGHDNLGLSTTVSGVQIDLSSLNAISLDAPAKTVRVGAGVRCNEVNGAGAPYDLVPSFGMSGTIGVSGITLGGGISWLCGRLGATCDSLLSAQIVTPSGKVLTASPRDNEDLFWAIRGGGGNFGVVTELTYQLHHIPTVLAGSLQLEVDYKQFLPFYQDFISRSPDFLDTSVTMTFGPTTRVSMGLCWSGDPAEGERVIQHLRTYGKVLRDGIRPQKFFDFQGGGGATRPGGGPVPGPSEMLWRGGQVAKIDEKVISALSDIEAAGPPSGCQIGFLHYMHGKLCDVDPNSSAYLRDRGQILYNIIAFPTGDEAERRKTWVANTYTAMQRVSTKKTYINYLSSNSEEAVRAAYGMHYATLQKLKRTYDPDNILRGNRNIRPR